MSRLRGVHHLDARYVKTTLEFAPHPDRLARRLFEDTTIELHLEALAARQLDDGGWPIT